MGVTVAEATERRNILIVLRDDQGWTTLGTQVNTLVPTPQLDRLAAEGHGSPLHMHARSVPLRGPAGSTARYETPHLTINPTSPT